MRSLSVVAGLAFLAILGTSSAQASIVLNNVGASVGTGFSLSSPLPSGFTLTGANLTSGSSAGVATQPSGTMGEYLAVEPGQTATFTYTGGNLASFGFLWGTIDAYNHLLVTQGTDVLNVSGGGLGLGTAGSAQTYVDLTGFSSSNPITFAFTSDSPAFEAANFSFATSNVGGVPEPATWAMMIVGFAGVGFMAYRRKPKNGGIGIRLA